MTINNGQANAVNLVIDYLAQKPGPGGVIPSAVDAAGQLGALAEAANKQLMAGARFTEAAAAIATVEQLRAELAQLCAERDRLLMKLEPDRIIAPMRLDELEQLGSGEATQ